MRTFQGSIEAIPNTIPMNILISDTNYESDEETIKKIVDVLKKYPEEYEQAKILIQQMIKQLNQLISD